MKHVVIFLILVLCGIFAGIKAGQLLQKGIVTASVVNYSYQAQPQILKIPKLSINARIELVGLDNKNNMDIPKDVNDVGWYQYGPKPGEIGNSVIDGHLDLKTGPAIFYRLKNLVPGDQLIVIDSTQTEHHFKVLDKHTYPFDAFPIKTYFGKTSKRLLHLITCTGKFDTVAKNYSDRIVVTAEDSS